ncbi:MAG: mechanosensitive ion channel [Proteobacteria bacterium]|nr:mechanosensitive ion channel [Pseudomonadota bacterium]
MNDVERFLGLLHDTVRLVGAEISSVWFPLQFGLIALAAVLGLTAAWIIRRRLDVVALTMGWPALARQVAHAVNRHLAAIVFVVIAAAIRAVMLQLFWPSQSYVVGVAVSLGSAWVAIAVLAGLIRNQFFYAVVVATAWTLAALSILGLLDPFAKLLDAVAVTLGGLRISLLLVLKTALFLLVTLWFATAAGDFLDRRVRAVSDLTPSMKVLIGKLLRIALVTLAIVIVLSSVGIDLSALALFSGAVGVGIGFGLQKIVSNLFSGIILLADKSIKPGDVISVGESFGWVDTMGARFTSVVVRDGREILIPNEDLVTQRVINWSHSNDQIRLEVPFGVSYGSDPHVVKAIAVAAAAGVRRILRDPAPVCHLTKFGDFSLDFILRFWIRDPTEGITNVRSEVLLALWDIFKREGVAIPFPVRDVQFNEPIRVVVEPPGD